MKHLRNWILLSLVIGTGLGLTLRYVDLNLVWMLDHLGWLCAALVASAASVVVYRWTGRPFYVWSTGWICVLALVTKPQIHINWGWPLPSAWHQGWVFFESTFLHSFLGIGILSLFVWAIYFVVTSTHEELRKVDPHRHRLKLRLPKNTDPPDTPPPTKTPHH